MKDNSNSVGSDTDTPAPALKRPRVTQACDSCRRRKAKCDGNQPCSACRASGLRCAYALNTRLNSLAYITSLEEKVSQLEKLLRGSSRGASERVDDHDFSSDAAAARATTPPEAETIESMMVVGQDDSEQQHVSTDFGGLRILDRLHRLCGTVSANHGPPDHQHHNPSSHNGSFSSAFDLAPPEFKPCISWDAYAVLPSRDSIHHAIDTVVNAGCCNLQFLSEPSLIRISDEALQAAEKGTSEPDHRSLSLIFAVLALARRFDVGEASNGANTDDDTAYSIRFFRASRALLDPSDCQDLVSLQAIICVAFYAQSCSMLSTCHSYICMAVAAALHMGLYDKDVNQWPPRELAEGKAVAAVLFIMDAYATTALGLPRMLRDVEVESVLVGPHMPSDIRDPMHGTHCCVHLASILAETVESNYPVPRHRPKKNGTYGIRRTDLDDSERKLASWFQQLDEISALPSGLDKPHDKRFLRSQLLLRIYHSHAEIVLYRPFIHHALRSRVGEDETAIKAYACGSACVKASMQVVWLVEKMESCGVFNAACWYVTLIVAFAATCLALYVKGAQEGLAIEQEIGAILRLKAFCARFSGSSSSIRRCSAFLHAYFPENQDRDAHHRPDHQAANQFDHFNRDLTEFRQALERNQAFQAPVSEDSSLVENDNLLPGLLLPRFQSFVNRSL